MWKFMKVFVYAASRPQSTTKRLLHIPSQSIWDEDGESDAVGIIRQPHSMREETSRHEMTSVARVLLVQRVCRPRLTGLARQLHAAFFGFVLWFGLLFAAMLVGTFAVLGIVMAYGLFMSLVGRWIP